MIERGKLWSPPPKKNDQKVTKNSVRNANSFQDHWFRPPNSAPARRTKSHNVYLYMSPISQNAESLAASHFKAIIERLKGQHLWTSRMSLGHFRWLFPSSTSTKDQLQVFQALSRDPMTVPTIDLVRFLDLESSDNESGPTKSSQHHFYIRSWIFTLDELTSLIGYMTEEDNTSEEILRWSEIVAEQRKSSTGTDLLTIRYIGTCQGPRRPIDRFNEDVQSRRSGIFNEFIRVIELLIPHVHSAAEVHLIKQASLSLIAPYNADDVERFLIEYFGHSTLLNRQRGGYYTSYVPPREDKAKFEALNTRFYSNFLADSTADDGRVSSLVKSHFECVQAFANARPETTSTSSNPFTDSVRNTCISQAIPRQYKGNTILAFLGKDITIEDFVAERTFIGGKSRAGLLTRDFVRRLAETEEQNFGREWSDQNFDPGFFTFFDLWPWLWHKDEDDAVEFIRSLLSAIRPILLVTYSRPVNGIVRANFSHASRALSSAFADRAGELTIQYYTEKDGTGRCADDDAFINIPHIHPGRDKYGIQDLELRKVLDMTMQLTFLVADVTLGIVQDFSAISTKITRKKLCEIIINSVESRLLAPSGRVWSQAFVQAKAELQKKWATSFNRLASENSRPILTSTGLQKLMSFGQADGEPHSSKRREQLRVL